MDLEEKLVLQKRVFTNLRPEIIEPDKSVYIRIYGIYRYIIKLTETLEDTAQDGYEGKG